MNTKENIFEELKEQGFNSFQQPVEPNDITPDLQELTTKTTKDNTEDKLEELLEKADMSKDEMIDMMEALISEGEIAQDFSILGGRIVFTLKSKTLSETREFILFFEELKASTASTVSYFHNLNTLATFLSAYRGKEVEGTLEQKRIFIEENIPAPLYDILIKYAIIFGQKLQVLSEKEAVDFF